MKVVTYIRVWTGAALLVALMVCSTSQGKTAEHKPKKYLGPIKPFPGGGMVTIDHRLWQQWESVVIPNRPPFFPRTSKLDPNKPERIRYLLHIDVSRIQMAGEFYEDDYFHFVYKTHEGDYLGLAVPSMYRPCFDDIRKKFDGIQAIVIPKGKDDPVYEVYITMLRQCAGDFKLTGGKLKSPLGDD